MDHQELAALPIFKSFKPHQLQLIKPFMEFCSFPANMVIFHQGDRADNFFILTAGEIALHFKPYDGPPLEITKIASGDVFGWSAALGRKKYSAAAIATSDSKVIRMQASNLQKICAIDPDTAVLFLDRLVGVISVKLQDSHQEILNLFSNGMNLNSDCKRRMKINGSENRIYA
jgi:CRP-like cAMP-binding protein